MKLELKHLAVYFPYAIKLLYCDASTIERLIAISDNDKIYTDLAQDNCSEDFLPISDYKPILRPMSDLPKFIDEISPVHNFSNIEILMKAPLTSSYEVFERLVELHFDVFRLIDIGLAVDVNSL